ncbi:MAG: von Willebrand factor type A domain-containing protein [Bacteroidota bacterium]
MKTIAIILVAALSFLGYSQFSRGTIEGKVTDSTTGKPVVNALITVLKDGNFVKSSKSASDGTYIINEILIGNYSVKVTHTDYQTQEKKSISITENSTVNIDFKLKKVEVINDLIEVEESKVLPNISTSYKKDKAARCESFAGGYVTSSYDNDDSYQNIDWNTEGYDKINENIFKDVLNNPLSTFSVDVDRAAYSNVRRFLQNNQKPYIDAVRIEEMINYFDYKYPQPTNGDPFSINVELSKCPWNAKHDLLHIGLQGENINEAEIPANNLVFLLDVSGSMGDANKLPLLKQAFKILVKNLRPEDKVAIVVYAGAAGEVLSSTSGDKKETIIAALDRLESGGSTAGGAGINLAYSIAKQNYIPDGNNRVILATDGDFNVGSSSDSEMERLIEEKRKDGVFLTILGFGMGNYKDSKMEKISNAGNGNYAYIDNILEAKKVFGKELWGTLYTIAKDVKFQIEFNPSEVKAYRLIGYENRILNKEDFNDDKKDAGEIGCGHTVTALYEIIPANSDEPVSNVDELEYQKLQANASKNFMTVKLRYKKPKEDVSNLILNRYKRTDIFTDKPSENFNLSAAVAEFGLLLRDSEFKADASYEHTLILAKNSKGVDEFGYRTEFVNLIETAELLMK